MSYVSILKKLCTTHTGSGATMVNAATSLHISSQPIAVITGRPYDCDGLGQSNPRSVAGLLEFMEFLIFSCVFSIRLS